MNNTDKQNLDLCKDHKQEWKQSHYAEHNCDYCKLEKQLEMAVWRIKDMLEGDDGQAFKEAEKFLEGLKRG